MSVSARILKRLCSSWGDGSQSGAEEHEPPGNLSASTRGELPCRMFMSHVERGHVFDLHCSAQYRSASMASVGAAHLIMCSEKQRACRATIGLARSTNRAASDAVAPHNKRAARTIHLSSPEPDTTLSCVSSQKSGYCAMQRRRNATIVFFFDAAFFVRFLAVGDVVRYALARERRVRCFRHAEAHAAKC